MFRMRAPKVVGNGWSPHITLVVRRTKNQHMQFSDLISAVQELDDALRRRAATAVNVALTARNWLIGAWIVEFERGGSGQLRRSIAWEIAQAVSVKGLSATRLTDLLKLLQRRDLANSMSPSGLSSFSLNCPSHTSSNC